jgi:tRNA pseudouridine65 synthase
MKETPICVLFHDEHYVAVHKPPAVLVHRSWLSQDDRFLLQMVRDRIGRRVYPVHRLDRATSGVIVFGLSSRAAERLHSAFGRQEAEKRYQAVVRGWPGATGVIDHPLDDPETGGPRRPALTRYRLLAQTELAEPVDRYPTARYGLVEARPLTGRRHQIRKHLKHISHHIVGDTTYGKGSHNRFFRERFGIHRLLLRAQSLGFNHPFTGERLLIRAAPEPDWDALMAALGWPTA